MVVFTSLPKQKTVARHCSTLALVAMLAATAGCAEVAGLQDHQAYQGFPDSSSAPCSNGLLTVNCDAMRNTAPQDGLVLKGAPSYQISGSDVHDNLTGLSWYSTTGGAMSHDEAIDYCDVLPGDYRLPTRLELISLLDFRDKSQVRIDSDVFTDVKAAQYWTATPYGTEVDQFWSVDFCSICNAEYPVNSVYKGTPTNVLCVKSGDKPFDVGPFEVTGVENRFLRDTRTGLMWMKKPTLTNKNWAESLDWCAKAPDGAYGDFRMPNAKELLTIVDDTKVGTMGPAVRDPFEIQNNEEIWSSTPARGPGKIFALNATGGSLGQGLGSYTYLQTLCVRGPD